MVSIRGDEGLNECFTRFELRQVPSIVARWKRLRTLHLVGLPGELVTEGMRQATTAYLHGLSSATIILCRAVIEFALQEAVSALGGTTQGLAQLLIEAQEYSLLPPRIAAAARRIKGKGNRAVHRGGGSEEQALSVLKDTRDVLRFLYKTPRGAAEG